MKPIIMDYANKKIYLSSAFQKKALIPGTTEYDKLQAVRCAHSGFEVETRQFKKNTKQERYKGLTYDYMRWYIEKVETAEDAKALLKGLDDMIDISKAHSTGRRYPTIKKWFLDCYPEFAEFGMTDDELEAYRSSRLVELENTNAAASEDKIPA